MDRYPHKRMLLLRGSEKQTCIVIDPDIKDLAFYYNNDPVGRIYVEFIPDLKIPYLIFESFYGGVDGGAKTRIDPEGLKLIDNSTNNSFASINHFPTSSGYKMGIWGYLPRESDFPGGIIPSQRWYMDSNGFVKIKS